MMSEEENELINNYELEIFTPPCNPGAERFAATARLKTDISQIFPYLNATLKGAVYYPAAQALTWKKGGHNVAFHAYEISTSNAEDREAALSELEGIISLVNRTWARRGEIEPVYEVHQRPTPMAVYKLLPQTNCRQCGESTCYSFALKLITSQKQLDQCPPLFDKQFSHNLASLQEIIIEAPRLGKGEVYAGSERETKS
jgi:ArsR family metal-binding transcriptional regulator